MCLTLNQSLYQNVSYMYPDANIWVVGHSLGGALSTLVGVTFGAHVVAFEAPGAKLAAKRLHLPTPVSGYSPFFTVSPLTVLRSLLCFMSLKFTIPRTPSPWGLVTESYLLVPWED